MSDDEFDNIPDNFADIEGVDWANLLAGPSEPVIATSTGSGVLNDSISLGALSFSRQLEPQDETRGSSPARESNGQSSPYFSDGDVLDSSFLAELNRVEQRALNIAPPTSAAGPSRLGAQSPAVDNARTSRRTLVNQLPDEDGVRSSRHFPNNNMKDVRTKGERAISTSVKVAFDGAYPEDTVEDIPSSRTGKMKATNIEDILTTYEDELTCPICCDLLVAAHVGNPCGHTFCGECGWQWHIAQKNQGCPCCRQTLDDSMPMIPNIAIDNTVEKHVKALALSGAMEWESNGRRYLEWTARKEMWRQRSPKRKRKTTLRFTRIDAFQVFDPPALWLEDNVGLDSDVELIPRPIRRARQSRRRPRLPDA